MTSQNLKTIPKNLYVPFGVGHEWDGSSKFCDWPVSQPFAAAPVVVVVVMVMVVVFLHTSYPHWQVWWPKIISIPGRRWDNPWDAPSYARYWLLLWQRNNRESVHIRVCFHMLKLVNIHIIRPLLASQYTAWSTSIHRFLNRYTFRFFLVEWLKDIYLNAYVRPADCVKSDKIITSRFFLAEFGW